MNQRESENGESWLFPRAEPVNVVHYDNDHFISLSGKVACYPERDTLGMSLPLLEIVNTRFRRILEKVFSLSPHRCRAAFANLLKKVVLGSHLHTDQNLDFPGQSFR